MLNRGKVLMLAALAIACASFAALCQPAGLEDEIAAIATLPRDRGR